MVYAQRKLNTVPTLAQPDVAILRTSAELAASIRGNKIGVHAMNKKTIGTIAIVAALVAVLAVPVLAQAGRGNAATPTRDKTTIAATKAQAKVDAKAKAAAKKAQRAAAKSAAKAAREAKRTAAKSARAAAKAEAKKAQLQKRIGNKLNARTHRFDAAGANLTKRISRLAALAIRVEAAGGDVSGVNAKLDIARQHLASALALEQAAIAKFQAIPTAVNRKAAFVEARNAGRVAVAELKVTRVAIRDAAASLRIVVKGLLPSETATETVNAQ